jgi:hypothetical protein
MRFITKAAVILTFLLSSQALPAQSLFPNINKYYVGEVLYYDNELPHHNEVCHDFNGDGVGNLLFLKPYNADEMNRKDDNTAGE